MTSNIKYKHTLETILEDKKVEDSNDEERVIKSKRVMIKVRRLKCR